MKWLGVGIILSSCGLLLSLVLTGIWWIRSAMELHDAGATIHQDYGQVLSTVAHQEQQVMHLWLNISGGIFAVLLVFLAATIVAVKKKNQREWEESFVNR